MNVMSSGRINMKYSKEEAFEEVLKRGRVLKRKHAQRAATLLSMSAGLVMAALIVVVGRFGGAGVDMPGQSAYGSFLLPNQAGGYVLAAVIAFAIGIAITLGIQRFRHPYES